MFRWFRRRQPTQPVLNRANRRALIRLSRPTRGVVDPIVNKLRKLPIRDRLAVLDSLPVEHRIILEERL